MVGPILSQEFACTAIRLFYSCFSLLVYFYCARDSRDIRDQSGTLVLVVSIVFVRVFFSVHTITHEPLHAAWWNLAYTCPLTTARNPVNIEVIMGHRTGLSDFSPLRVDRAKKLVYTITDEPLHSAWWYFARTCILTTARNLFDFKVQRSRSFIR